MSTANRIYYTSQDLIDSIKRRTNIPDAQAMLSDNEILELANDEMNSALVPMILSKHENYFLISEVIPFERDKLRYAIPYRAIANKLREVYFIQDTHDIRNLREMFQISADDLSQNNYSAKVNHFYIEGEDIVLHTAPSQILETAGMKIFYWLKPNTLVLGDRVGIITGIDRTNGILTFSSIPDNFEANQKYDFIRTRSPHKIISYDITVTNVNTMSNFITLDPNDIPETLEVGDRVASAGETDLVNCPTELHPLLAQMTATMVLESLGDNQNLVLAAQRLQKMQNDTGLMIDNRVVGSPMKVRRRNSPIRMKNSKRYRRF